MGAGGHKLPGSVRLRGCIVGPDLEDFVRSVFTSPLVLLKPSIQDPFIVARAVALASLGLRFCRFRFPLVAPCADEPVQHLQLGWLRRWLSGGSFERGE